MGALAPSFRRRRQHNNDFVEGFTKRYGVHRLVWYETHPTMESAIVREKQLKGWHRSWKIRLIEEMNYDWVDLYTQGRDMGVFSTPEFGGNGGGPPHID